MEARPVTLTVVSYHTPDERYTTYAERLRQSCGKLGMPFLIVEMPPYYDTWVEMVSLKPQFMRRAMAQLNGPILWVDADGVLVQRPEVLMKTDVDFAIYAKDRGKRAWRPIGRELETLPDEWPFDDTRWFMTGTIFVNNTGPGQTFLRDWETLATAEPKAYQMLLCQKAWCMCKPRTAWMPETYCDVYGRSKHPVIMHELASTRRPKGEQVVRA